MINFNYFAKKIKVKKLERFIFFGLINAILTNLILQIMLLFSSTISAAFVSQFFNFNFGYYFYGKKVFIVRSLNKNSFIKYILLNLLIWNINWLLINFLNSFNISRSLASLILIPFLALLSFLFQKYFVFR